MVTSGPGIISDRFPKFYFCCKSVTNILSLNSLSQRKFALKAFEINLKFCQGLLILTVKRGRGIYTPPPPQSSLMLYVWCCPNTTHFLLSVITVHVASVRSVCLQLALIPAAVFKQTEICGAG